MTADPRNSKPIGRGAGINPPNRFEQVRTEDDWEHLDGAEIQPDVEQLPDARRVPTLFMPDWSQSLITQNNSPDVPFRYSLNPYRGCEHSCVYCCVMPRWADGNKAEIAWQR